MLIVTALSVFVFSQSMAFDPETGEMKDGANCDQYYTQINQISKQLNDLPPIGLSPADSGYTQAQKTREDQSKKFSDQAFDAQTKAQKEGCQPDPTWGVHGGKFNAAKTATNEQIQFVPASGSETGVPMNFDFIGMIGGLIGNIAGGGGSVFPAVKGALAGAASSATGSGASRTSVNENPYDTSDVE